MAIYYARDKKYDKPPAGHEFVAEFSIQCTSTDGTTKQVPQFRYRYAVGKVVATWEHNGYHDSDFMARYLSDDGTFAVTEYATTRFPCSGCSADIDATPEVMEAYEAHLAEQREIEKARREAVEKEESIRFGITVEQLRKLRNTYGGPTLAACERLLKTKNFRSDFRASLCNQLRDWLATDNPKYPSPFSPRQLECLR